MPCRCKAIGLSSFADSQNAMLAIAVAQQLSKLIAMPSLPLAPRMGRGLARLSLLLKAARASWLQPAWLSHAWLQPLESGAIQSCSWLETAQILNIMLHMPWNIGCVVVHVHGLVIVEMCIGQWLYLVVWVHSWHLHCVGLHSSTSVLLCGYMLTPWCCCV